MVFNPKIRENQNGRTSRLLRLQQKAMKGDREEILNAGVRLPIKPIDIQQLISLISIWIYK
jgi:hypothetical protein